MGAARLNQDSHNILNLNECYKHATDGQTYPLKEILSHILQIPLGYNCMGLRPLIMHKLSYSSDKRSDGRTDTSSYSKMRERERERERERFLSGVNSEASRKT